MKFDELRIILKKENIDESCFNILENDRQIRGYDGYVIEKDKENGKYILNYIERGILNPLQHNLSEEEVCAAFLKEMAADYQVLTKYID